MEFLISEGKKCPTLLVGNFLSSDTKIRNICEDLAERLSATGWQVQLTSKKSNRALRLVDMVITILLKRNSFSVAHIDLYSGLSFIWAEIVCYALCAIKKPFIVTLRGGNLPSFAQQWPNRVRRLLGLAVNVTAPSKYLLEKMKKFRSDILLIPNPIDISRYDYRQRVAYQPKIVWLRAFHKIYNPCLALRVLKLLESNFRDSRLIMIGPDTGDGTLQLAQRMASKLGVTKRVHFVGGVSNTEVPLWLNKCDIFINTTNVDNTPISVIEAMACGLGIISTNVGGIPYLLEHEYNALLVPPDAPELMTAAIKRILTEQGLAEKLSKNARKKVEQFDWSLILPRWEILFMSATKNLKK